MTPGKPGAQDAGGEDEPQLDRRECRHVAVAEDEPREGGGRSPEERGGEDEPARIEAEAAGAIGARTRRLARRGDVREAGAGRASRSVQPSLCAG